MAKYDLELLIKGLQTFLQANLNTQIAALNAEKGDSIVLKTVAATSWHLQYLGDAVDPGDPIMLIEEADEPLFQGSGARLAVTYHLLVWAIVNDNGTDPSIPIRLYRYRRAMLDLIQANWDQISNGYKMVVSATDPTPNFKQLGLDMPARAIGVRLKVAIAD